MSNFEMKEIKEIEGLKVILPFFVQDERGFFLKGYESEIFKEFGIDGAISEDFESFSTKGVLRGMHFQNNNPQTKMVRVLSGEIYDVAVDLRQNSATYGKWHAEILSSENHKMYYIPEGFAHGFLVLSESALVQYKCIGKYLKGYDTGIIWNDIDLAIEWPIDEVGKELIIAEKDKKWNTFSQFKIENEKNGWL